MSKTKNTVKSNAKRKRMETLDFVLGLLCSADEIAGKLPNDFHPREQLHKKYDISGCTPDQIREFGMYQGRVVLVSLAAELALKFAWEQEHKDEVAETTHDLKQLFDHLSPHSQERIRSEYVPLGGQAVQGWKTVDQVFKTCRCAFENWRYIIEEDNFPNFIMQATYLKHAALSVIKVAQKTTRDGEITG